MNKPHCYGNMDWVLKYPEDQVCQDLFSSPSYQTKEEAIEAGLDEAKSFNKWANNKTVEKISVGRTELIPIPSIDVCSLLESIDEEYHDQISGDIDGGEYIFEKVSNEQEKELEEKLNEVFSEWVEKYGIEPDYYTVEAVEDITVAALPVHAVLKIYKMDDYYTIAADTEEAAKALYLDQELGEEEEMDIREADSEGHKMWYPLDKLPVEYRDKSKYPRGTWDGDECVEITYREAMIYNNIFEPYVLSVSSDLL